MSAEKNFLWEDWNEIFWITKGDNFEEKSKVEFTSIEFSKEVKSNFPGIQKEFCRGRSDGVNSINFNSLSVFQ